MKALFIKDVDACTELAYTRLDFLFYNVFGDTLVDIWANIEELDSNLYHAYCDIINEPVFFVYDEVTKE